MSTLESNQLHLHLIPNFYDSTGRRRLVLSQSSPPIIVGRSSSSSSGSISSPSSSSVIDSPPSATSSSLDKPTVSNGLFPYQLVSRRHAHFFYSPDGVVMIEDLNSKHGTSLNGKRLSPNIPAILHSGDDIILSPGRTTPGSQKVRFTVKFATSNFEQPDEIPEDDHVEEDKSASLDLDDDIFEPPNDVVDGSQDDDDEGQDEEERVLETIYSPPPMEDEGDNDEIQVEEGHKRKRDEDEDLDQEDDEEEEDKEKDTTDGLSQPPPLKRAATIQQSATTDTTATTTTDRRRRRTNGLGPIIWATLTGAVVGSLGTFAALVASAPNDL